MAEQMDEKCILSGQKDRMHGMLTWNKKIRGVIFDLDGVLLDSMSIWNDLGIRYLAKRGIQAPAELSQILFSMSMEQGAEYMQREYQLPMTAQEVQQGIEQMLRDFYFYEVPEKEGASELLKGLARRNISMIAATSSPREHVTAALTRLGLISYLKAILTTTEVGESKHSPKIYLEAAEILKFKPQEICVFEDSLYALKTAAQAGFYTVGVFDKDGESDQAGMQKTADMYVKSFKELI